MNGTTTRSVLLEDLIERIAFEAFDTNVFLIYTNTARALQRPVKDRYPHLVAVGRVSQKVEIVGMVETDESLRDLDAATRRWRALEHLQAAAYLYVPRGRGTDARTLCLRETVRLSDFRHYWFEGETLYLERCFA
jgi:hypothetical protein